MPGDLRLLLLSDATGSTLAAAVKAVLSQFPATEAQVTMHPFLRRPEDIAEIAEPAFASASAVIYTLVSPDLRAEVDRRAALHGIPTISLLDPVTQLLERLSASRPAAIPGSQYRVDDRYMDQIRAMDFAVSHDDGQALDRLLSADIILTGVSRTSKTPTCIYLGYQGVRAANVPLVPGQTHYPDLEEAHAAGVPVIGLTARAQRLSQVRKTRLRSLGSPELAAYSDIERIEEELVQARLFFDRLAIPVIDVSRRSIEETSAEVLRHLRGRRRGGEGA